MRQRYAEFQQQGAEILAISSEEQEAGAKFKESSELPFLILVDAELRVINAYGIFHENEPKGRSIARPATFVLNSDGMIHYRYIGENAGDRPSADEILGVLPTDESG